jgi:multiple sugar transport system substrate-binding protein
MAIRGADGAPRKVFGMFAALSFDEGKSWPVRRLITDGVSPAAVASFREQESLDAFVAGEAVFLRSWPYADGYLRRGGFTEEQFGVAPLPAADPGGRSASCLGGWNLMINASSSEAEQEAAWTLVQYLTDPAQQRLQALQAGLLPILEALYEDADLVGEIPVLALGKEVFDKQLHARPLSPFYSEISASIASAFNRTLLGELTGSEAAQLLEKELRAIVARNR